MKKFFTNQKGFTLIEILLVVAAIAILAGIVIVAINPNKQLGDTRNSQRRADVTTIANAVGQYALDNEGVLPSSITATSTEICSTTGASCIALIDLGVLTNNQKYIVGMPFDRHKVTPFGTGYTVFKTAQGKVVVSAPLAEHGVLISVSR